MSISQCHIIGIGSIRYRSLFCLPIWCSTCHSTLIEGVVGVGLLYRLDTKSGVAPCEYTLFQRVVRHNCRLTEEDICLGVLRLSISTDLVTGIGIVKNKQANVTVGLVHKRTPTILFPVAGESNVAWFRLVVVLI